MKYLDVFLSDEDRLLVETVRRFVDEEIMPQRQLIDDDKDHVIVRRILQGFTDLGLRRAGFPEEYGGVRGRGGSTHLVLEEIARGDAGIAVAFSVTGWAWMPAIAMKNQAVLAAFAPAFCGDEVHMACFAMTEPEGGCDIENLGDLHGRTIHTTARLDGEEWVLDGAKRFPSNAGVSDLYCVVCQTDPGLGEQGIALIYVPSPHPGLSFGKFENKAGMQGDRNCDIYFDGVRVPKAYRAGGPGLDGLMLKANLTTGRVASAAMAVGCAQGAFERVLQYTSDRIVAGKPIRQHSICAGMIADMAIGIETARAYYLQVAHMLRRADLYGQPFSDLILSRASAAKVYACDVANAVANQGMELMGSYGYMREYDVEKYWRDCKEIQLWLGGAQLGRLDVARGY